jgi:hypothetical protein
MVMLFIYSFILSTYISWNTYYMPDNTLETYGIVLNKIVIFGFVEHRGGRELWEIVNKYKDYTLYQMDTC